MKGVTLQPELYKVCDSIRLHNVSIGGHYTDEYMQLYFESGRSGGGQKTVRSVELLGNGEAVVVFEDPKGMCFRFECLYWFSIINFIIQILLLLNT